MSAALQLTSLRMACGAQQAMRAATMRATKLEVTRRIEDRKPVAAEEQTTANPKPAREPVITLAFYRKHSERLLRRYLYASMLVGRAPSILGDPVSRGWASSRPVHTFEDAVIFVLDVEKCLDQLGGFDRMLLARLVLQEYSQDEASVMLGMSVRGVNFKFSEALDRLTQLLLDAGLLTIPKS